MGDPQLAAEGLFEWFEKYNSFVEGNRHNFMLKLGRVARSKGFSLDFIARMATIRYENEDFTSGEIRRTLSDGYQHVKCFPKSLKAPNRGHQNLGATYASITGAVTHEDVIDLYEKSEEIRASAPLFSDEIFGRLPLILQKGITAAQTPQQRDMLLMGMLAVLSGCIPKVSVVYSRKIYYPHFYFAAVSHAGTGKGILDLAHLLAEPLHAWYEKLSEAEMQQYEERKLDWELEIQKANKERRKPDRKLKPEEPPRISLLLEAYASKIRCLTTLRDNKELGVIINASEMDTLTSALGMDCGKQDDILRNATHHEPIGASHKINGAPIRILKPRIALCLSGTPDQFVRLVQSQENGLYSRFALLTAKGQLEWIPADPKPDDVDYEAMFTELGQEVLLMHRHLLESPTRVVFEPMCWETHAAYFSKRLNEVLAEENYLSASVIYRHGLLTTRIATILTAMRKWEDKWFSKEFRCLQSDFLIAMRLADVLIEHSLLLSTSLPAHPIKAQPLRNFFKIRLILENLNDTFSFSEFVEFGNKLGLSISTLKRYLKKSIKYKLIDKEENNYIKKKSSPLFRQ